MSAMFDSPMDRDLRSARKDSKRFRDSKAKWALGSRPSVGCALDLVTYEPVGGSEGQRARVRPRSKPSEQTHRHHGKKGAQNITKAANRVWLASFSPARPNGAATDEAEDVSPTSARNLADLCPDAVCAARAEAGATAANFGSVLYSFDRSDTPGLRPPLTLDAFVKKVPAARQTEQLVQLEYEILDANGDTLHGRKARSTLRRAAGTAAHSTAATADADDDYELV